MLARIRAQAAELLAKSQQASERGDQVTFERTYREWCKLMRWALSL